jgi:hypothetical protein
VIRPKHIVASLLLTILAFAASDAQAHSAFKKYISSKFPTKKMSCDVCHVKGQKKDVKNSYGQLFIKVMNKPNLTKEWKAKKGADKKAYEKEVMVPAFEKAFKKISKMTFEDLVKYNMIDGVKGPTPSDSDSKDEEKGKNEADAATENKKK